MAAPGKAAVSFEEFAKRNGIAVRGKCSVCTLPPDVLEQVHNAHAAGYRGTAINRYLVSLGYELTGARVDNHFGRGHNV